MKDKKTNPDLISACFISLYSLEDLAKSIQFYSGAPKPLFAIKNADNKRLFVLGPKLHSTRLIFFFDVDAKDSSKYLTYKSADAASNEEISLSSGIKKGANNIQYIPIVELSKNIFKEKKITNMLLVKVNDPDALVKALIAKSIDTDALGKIYRFRVNNKYFIATLSLLGSDDSNIFYYSELKDADLNKGFFRYDYNNDIITQTDKITDTTFLYLRIIDLKEGFSFFKPE
ncbi:MAG: hypothetical protein ACP5UN_00270 [Candidatus Micrarchaeia archaeon]